MLASADRASRRLYEASLCRSHAELNEALRRAYLLFAVDCWSDGWQRWSTIRGRRAADPAIELLEYANGSLLEFRHYDTCSRACSPDVLQDART